MADKSLKDKAIDIKGKKYVQVADRILYFNEVYKNGMIETKILSELDADRVVVKAVVCPHSDKPEQRFTGHSQAVWGDGYINKTSALENCETSAIGRALALMGIGVIDSVASVDEVNKAGQIAASVPPPSWIKDIGYILEGKGITEPADKQKIVKELSGDEGLNSSGLARLKKTIIETESDTLKLILEN